MSSNIPPEEDLLDAITKNVFLVMLRCSWPKMSYQIADAIVEIKVDGEEKKEVDAEFRTKPQWQLMPAAWRSKLTNLEGRARSLLSAASIQFAARGMSVLPIARAGEIFAGLRALRTELEGYRDEFVQDYEGILVRLEESLDGDLFEKVQGKLPAVETVASKFSLVWAIIPAGGKQSVSETELGQLQDVLNHAIQMDLQLDDTDPAVSHSIARAGQVLDNMRARSEQQSRTIDDDEASELVQEAQQQMRSFTNDMLEDMAREPRRVLVDAADNLLEALKNPDRIIRSGTINQVRDAFQMLEGFKFLAGDQLLARMRECRASLEDMTPRTLNSNAEIGAQLAAGLTGVREEAADTRAAATAMRQFRGIKLRDKSKTKRQPTAV